MYDMTLSADLLAFLHGPKSRPEKIARLAHRFLVSQGLPTDMPHILVALKSLDDLWEQERGD